MSSGPASIAFLGFGLIGGSIARALGGARASAGGRPRLVAWSPSGGGPRAAAAAGVIDRAARSEADALAGAELVVIAAPPIETLTLLGRLGADLHAALGAGAVVTDVASTKVEVMGVAARSGIRFVGGHPMAGREASGYDASDPALFADRPWVVVAPEGARGDLADPVHWLADACGARPIALEAAAHDVAVAAISHLPLVAAAALVEAAGRGGDGWPLARSLAASGWESMTRLARGDPRMAAGIAATNAAAIAEALRAYRDALDAWLAALERDGGPDAGDLERRFEAVRSILEEPPGTTG